MSRAKGNVIEKKAAKLVKNAGYQILACNYTCKMGEIDIIARHKTAVIFIEVKYRQSAQFGTAAEMVTYSKQQKILKAAQHFLMKHPNYENYACRFDVIAITRNEIEWLKGCFD